MIDPIVKWSGSKRSQVDEILRYFPRQIDTYYEPFVGGGSVLYKLLSSSMISINTQRINNELRSGDTNSYDNKNRNKRHVKQVICSDINPDLISLWNLIKSSPEALIDHYKRLWNELYYISDIESKKQFYYNIRERFNKHKDPKDFFFLTRTAINGLIRYNSKREFNTSFHFSRDGIKPENIREILFDWHKKIQHVDFICQDYREIHPTKHDFCYIDPPYAGTNAMYYGTIDYKELWEWMRTLKCPYLLSFNGICGSDDKIHKVPKDIYDSHIYIDSGCSSFKRLHSDVVVEYVQDSLYIKGCELIKEVTESRPMGNVEVL